MRRFLSSLLAVIVLVASMASSVSAAPVMSDPKLTDLPNVQKALKLSPEQVKEVYAKTRKGEITPNGIVGGGVWVGGYWLDVLDTSWLRNNTGQTPAIEYLRLGTGRCTDDTVATSITLTINGTRGSNYQNSINSSFGFSMSGTRTWTRVEKYCGPTDANMLRIFYKQGIYNDYQAVVYRMYYTWNGYFHHLDLVESRVVQVPHPSYPTRDIRWQG